MAQPAAAAAVDAQDTHEASEIPVISLACVLFLAAQVVQAAAAAAVDPEDADELVAAAALNDSDAERMLEGLLWEFTITKEAREEWSTLPPVYKCALHSSQYLIFDI